MIAETKVPICSNKYFLIVVSIIMFDVKPCRAKYSNIDGTAVSNTLVHRYFMSVMTLRVIGSNLYRDSATYLPIFRSKSY